MVCLAISLYHENESECPWTKIPSFIKDAFTTIDYPKSDIIADIEKVFTAYIKPALSKECFCSENKKYLAPSDRNIYRKLDQAGSCDKLNDEKKNLLSISTQKYNKTYDKYFSSMNTNCGTYGIYDSSLTDTRK